MPAKPPSDRSQNTNNKRWRSFLARWRWFVPGMGVKRYVLILGLALALLLVGFLQFARSGPFQPFFNRVTIFVTELPLFGQQLWVSGLLLLLLGLLLVAVAVIALNRSILRSLGRHPGEALEAIYVRRTLAQGPRIVALGGGTGLANLLSGLKHYTANLTAIVTVADDGGSSGRLRRDLDIPAVGDLVDCYAALSDDPALAELLTHRFDRGELKGHTFGNLMIATLAEQQDFAQASSAMNAMLAVRGRVIPATSENVTLLAELDDGSQVRGESALAASKGRTRRVRQMRLEPAAPAAVAEAVTAIENADFIIIGPGSLFTSLIPPLLVPAVALALRQSRADLLYIANIMTEAGETDGLSVFDHAKALAEHLGRWPDVVLANNAPVAAAVERAYAAEGAAVAALEPARFAALTSNRRQPRVKLWLAALTENGAGQHSPALLAQAIIKKLIYQRLWR
jgi:uncharacterized cofD-like protein